ncbi:MAG: DNA primase [Candidatus Paceibacterota bacterium]|jgi:DNA primase
MSSVVEQIKARLGVQDVVGSYLKLDGAGANLKAKCPFHAENTASFFVSPARGSYYCFGCNKGGDIFSFVQDIEGVDFRQALTLLADRAGVILVTGPEQHTDPHKILREIMETTTLFYQQELKEDNEPMDYLLKRGLQKETINNFRIGYAPDSWKKCLDYLLARGYQNRDIDSVGLSAVGKSGSSYDRFRQRIMFPIADSIGHVVAFTGRILETNRESVTVRDISTQGKYVNSPQTVLYNKSGVLYAYDKAKVSIRKENVCILVEGQMDAIMSHQAGLTNTVAVSGTALTNDHLMLVKRLTNNLILAFDADTAGVASSRRAVEMALDLDMDVRVAVVTDGKDPADSIKENPEAWKQSVKNSIHVIEYYLQVIREKTKDLRELRKRVEHEVLPLVVRLRSHIDQAHFIALIADRIDLKEDVIRESIRSMGLHKSDMSYKTDTTYITKATRTREDAIIEKILGIVFWQESEPAKATIDTGTVRKLFADIFGEQAAGREQALINNRERFMFEAEAQFAGSAEISKEIDRLFASLETEILKKKFYICMSDLKKSGISEAETKTLLEECQKMGSRLEVLKKFESKLI